jgi:hypothetical protein
MAEARWCWRNFEPGIGGLPSQRHPEASAGSGVGYIAPTPARISYGCLRAGPSPINDPEIGASHEGGD